MTIAPKPVSTFELAPQGTTLARCVRFIHMGTNEETIRIPGKAVETKMVDKIQLTFELPTKTKVFKEGEQAKPILVSKDYTFSMGSKANLRKVVEGMIGAQLLDKEAYSFDIDSLVGMPCIITIQHKTAASGNVRAEITNVVPLMEGQTCPDQVNASKILTFSNWNQEVFEGLPQFMKDKILSSQEYQDKDSKLTPEQKAKLESLHNAGVKSQEAFDEIDPNAINF